MTQSIHEQSTRLGGVGRSSADDPEVAARESVRRALGDRSPRTGDLVMIFPTSGYDAHALYAAAQAEAAPAAVVGASSFVAFTDAGPIEQGCVAAWVSGEDSSFGICHLTRDDDDIAGSARLAAETARERAGERHPHSVLLMLTDGLTPDQREVARGASEVTGAVIPLVGGAASDALRWEETFTFGEGTVRSNGIVGLWLNSSRPMGVGVGHGWRPSGMPMLVTRAEGTVIHELDGRPALEAYLSEHGGDVDPTDPQFLVHALEHPVGVPTGQGRYDVRQLHARLPEGGGMSFNTGMPQHTILQVMCSDADSLLAGAGQAARGAADQSAVEPGIALAFSCGARVPLLGDRLGEEVAAISRELGGAPVCGFFTFGEFGRVWGSTGVHNSSVAVLTL
jgi:hypothetical protein